LTNPLRPAACILDNFQRFATLRARVFGAHVPLLRIRTPVFATLRRAFRASRTSFATRGGVSSRDVDMLEK